MLSNWSAVTPAQQCSLNTTPSYHPNVRCCCLSIIPQWSQGETSRCRPVSSTAFCLGSVNTSLLVSGLRTLPLPAGPAVFALLPALCVQQGDFLPAAASGSQLGPGVLPMRLPPLSLCREEGWPGSARCSGRHLLLISWLLAVHFLVRFLIQQLSTVLSVIENRLLAEGPNSCLEPSARTQTRITPGFGCEQMLN